MSIQTAMDNINLKRTSRWGHTEYSLAYHKEYLARHTDLFHDDPEKIDQQGIKVVVPSQKQALKKPNEAPFDKSNFNMIPLTTATFAQQAISWNTAIPTRLDE